MLRRFGAQRRCVTPWLPVANGFVMSSFVLAPLMNSVNHVAVTEGSEGGRGENKLEEKPY